MKEHKNIGRYHLRNDILLIASLLIAAASLMLYLFVFRDGGDAVRVTVDGKLYGTYPLNVNITEDINSGENGEGLNRMVISDGKVRVDLADCPDGICVAHRPIFRDGESIVCLPNRVVVTVITDNSEDAPDIIV